MEILIKLDERLYENIKHHTLILGEIDEICDAISNGTPLPKGHGRLIDTDAIYNRIDTLNRGKNKGKYTGVLSIITCANTIIEANKE